MAFKKYWMARVWTHGVKRGELAELKVTLKLTVTDPEREAGRVVEALLTPEEARSLADSLNSHADRVDAEIEREATALARALNR